MLRKFRSQRIAKRQRRIFWTKFVLFWVFLIALVYLFSYISKLEDINIININVIGNKVIQEKDILEIVDKNIEGNYLWLFPKSNILIYPKSKIKEDLLNSSFRIRELVVSYEDFQTININMIERIPFALYCENLVNKLPKDEILDEQMATSTEANLVLEELSVEIKEEENLVTELPNKEECYFMDDEGFIYTKAMNFTDNVYFKYQGKLYKTDDLGVSPLSGDEILGEIYLSEAQENQFEKVNLFIRFLKDINIDVYKLMVKENGDYELSFESDSFLVFDEKQDFEILLENLQAVLIDLGDLGEKEFEYIDLRFDNKVLYKFKGIEN